MKENEKNLDYYFIEIQKQYMVIGTKINWLINDFRTKKTEEEIIDEFLILDFDAIINSNYYSFKENNNEDKNTIIKLILELKEKKLYQNSNQMSEIKDFIISRNENLINQIRSELKKNKHYS